ncbi:Mut7-C RNAse domain-containing protein [Nocardiopsis algeriensis]|uniref:Twitching motility protein PilT n=1 Tax=Nocardiopsis algeriensis TaxID=1478215 RepID=A0A841IRU5_9ACTN|nr:Mut7-C RNAse domain-containing protein [Nocardiopsis algeriensis]MBB6119986.1 hypothetical protein [Nocardiopsis algeriensis]
MEQVPLTLHVAPPLRFFLPSRSRNQDTLRIDHDSGSSLVHIVQSLGIPLTEVGRLRANGRDVPPTHRPGPGERIDVEPLALPQQAPTDPPRFLLDVHLGTLARRLRLLGIDTAYDNDRDDPSLVAQANAEQRVLLTRDRGLLCRRNLVSGAHVNSTRPDEQLREVLQRFAPGLRPWTRCPACNGVLVPAPLDEIARSLEPGTLATQQTFARCVTCDRVYWPGAHHSHLARIVHQAEQLLSTR